MQQAIFDPQGQLFARVYRLPANATPQSLPQTRREVTLGDGIGLLGYTAHPTPAQAGKTLYVELHWLVSAQPTHDWTVTVRVVTTDALNKSKRVAEQVNRPGEDSLLTTRWQPGWRLVDEYQIKLPPTLAPGVYALAVQLSTPQGAHLPADGTAVFLGTVTR